MTDDGIVTAAGALQADTLRLLESLVTFESPSSDKAAVDRLVTFLQREIDARGGLVERLPQVGFGDLLVSRWPGLNDRPPLFVMTHIDTVWPIGTLERLPWRADGEVIRGPGVYDMKASVAMMLSALDVLRGLDRFGRPVVWMINTEEEVGSPVSRPVIEENARGAGYVLCLEPPVPPQGALKTQRKGVGMFTLEVNGRAAHAGADFAAGVNAIEELARQVQRLHALTNLELGTTVNVGVVSGGTKRNVVPARAVAEVDLRVTTMAEAERVVSSILNATSSMPGASVTVTGGLNRPPMERTEVIVEAFERAKAIGRTVGLDLMEGATGGGSDGNFTAALGAPTIDGLGCPGDGAHADSEHILVAELPKRTALLAALLASL